MGRVNNPQSGEIALSNRTAGLKRLRQPMLALTDSAWRDVRSSEAELAELRGKISADMAAADKPPLTGRLASLTDAAVARTKIGSGSMDAGYARVENAAQQKRLKFYEGRSQRLGSAFSHQAGIAQRTQEDAEARQQKKNTKKAAIWNAVGTVAGAGLGAWAQNAAQTKAPLEPLNEAGIENILARPIAEGVDVPAKSSLDFGSINADDWAALQGLA